MMDGMTRSARTGQYLERVPSQRLTTPPTTSEEDGHVWWHYGHDEGGRSQYVYRCSGRESE